MHTKLLLTITLGLLCCSIFAQSFEGSLLYKVQIDFHLSEQMRDWGLTQESAKEKMIEDGSWTDSIKKCYKEGQYITYTYTNPISRSIYKQDSNKLYTLQDCEDCEERDLCIVLDASVDLSAKILNDNASVIKLDSVAQVNGVECSIVRIKWKLGSYDYYYNTSMLPMDPTLYQHHIHDGWAAYLSIAKALPLKVIQKMDMVTLTLTLDKYTEEEIDPKLFELPPLVPWDEMQVLQIGNIKYMKRQR